MKDERNIGGAARALTIAGSDSGGGAGMQADLKTFQALGAHGLSVVTCVTAQNPERITAIYELPAAVVRSQLMAVEEFYSPQCIKIGMLGSAEIVREVIRYLRTKKGAFVILDPAMISTSGRKLLSREALGPFMEELMPLCTLVTPNLPEAEFLLGRRICTKKEMRQGAKELQERFDLGILMKGGHLKGKKRVVDIFWDGKEELIFEAQRIRGITTHGTGCTYASAICAGVAKGQGLKKALKAAHLYIHGAIKDSRKCGRGWALDWGGKGKA